jgi:hypothetical protein
VKRIASRWLCLSALCVPLAAQAQSASDKATARQVATEGISLYRAGKYADALDRFKRAQALYDAPVHLLYIARSEAKLGHLVEASETYRSLDHVTLPDSAPAAWVQAVDDGRKELATLEPRVPKLRIIVHPAAPSDATLKIDGAPESAAVLGIARPTDPGSHHVELDANGFLPAEADATIGEGQQKDVRLELTAAPAGFAATTTGTTSGATTTTAAPVATGTATVTTSSEGTPVGFMVGLRIGAAIPTGTLLHVDAPVGTDGTDLDTSKAFGAGATLELHGGVRIGRYFTPLIYLAGQTLGSGDGYGVAGLGGKPSGTTAGEIGAGVMIGSGPGKFGGFGEFELLYNGFGLSHDVASGGEKCDVTAGGGALRFGGGGVFPAFGFLHVTPFATVTLGRFTNLNTSHCPANFPSGKIPAGDERTHGMIVLGVGGDFIFGKDKPNP